MRFRIIRLRLRRLPILLAVISLALTIVSLLLWRTGQRDATVRQAAVEIPRQIERSRHLIAHHLARLAGEESAAAARDGAPALILEIEARIRTGSEELYPELLAVRCYDENLELKSAESAATGPVPLPDGLLAARLGAGWREGLYRCGSEVDYRVVVPLFAGQDRLGALEFIFAPRVLLSGLDRVYRAVLIWQVAAGGFFSEKVPSASLSLPIGPDLFSGNPCRLIFDYRPPLVPGRLIWPVLVLLTVLVLLLFSLLQLPAKFRFIHGKPPARLRYIDGERDISVLSQAVEQSNVAVMVTDVQGQIEYVNRKFVQLTGYELEELVGQNPRILKSLATPPDVYQDLWRSLSAGKAWSGEFYNRKKSGELFWDVSYIAPVRDRNGRVIHFVAVKEDITERKQMEVELIAAKETAETANRAKSHFLANMSHEIRTPMNTIIGMTELTLKTGLDAEQRDYLKSVLLAAENLLTILDEILDLSKIEAGALRLDPAPFLLREQLRYWMNGMMAEAAKKNLEMLLDVDDDVPDALIGDFVRLGQILINLLANAVKFTAAGGVMVRVELSGATEDKETELHFMVSDTGVGVAEDKKREIFERFSQADSSSTRRFGGTGLGLAVCSELLGLMHGRIWVDSPSDWAFGVQPGPGSTFHFTVRLGRQFVAEEAYRSDFTLAGRLRTVIIHIQNQLRLKMIKSWCESGGLQVRIASSFTEAEQWFRQESASLFLSDGSDWPGNEVFTGPLPEQNRVIVYPGSTAMPIAAFPAGLGKEIGRMPICAAELLEQIASVIDSAPTVFTTIAPTASPTTGKRWSILVAEDNPLNRKLIGRLLEKAAYGVSFAENGLQAIEKLRQQSYDLVLMDIQMPELDGVAATIRLREEGFSLPIIALTAHALKGDREKFLEAGMDDYLCKPIRPEELHRLLDIHLDKSKR